VAAYTWPNVRVFLDTFMDLDRGYFPRYGLYDRRCNPRKGAHVLSNLKTVLQKEGSIEPKGIRVLGGCRVLEFASKRSEYKLLLPEGDCHPDTASLGLRGEENIIDLVRGLVNPVDSPLDQGNQCLIVHSG
jgi:hypothetical protein